MLEGVLLLPDLLRGGLSDGKEEGGSLHAHMAPLRLVDGGAGEGGAWPDDLVDVIPVQPHLEDGVAGLVLHQGVQPISEGTELCVAMLQRVQVRRMRAMVVPGDISTLVSGWAVGSV